MDTILNLWKDKRVRNWGLVVVAVIVVSIFAAGFSSADAGATTEATEVKVVQLEVGETIEASGSLEAQPFASLDWKTNGVVETVKVKPGDFVKAGDILIGLQPESTSASIVSAQADLVNAQKELEDLLTSGTDLAQATIDLKDAQEEYKSKLDYVNYLNNDKNIPLSDTIVYIEKTRGGGYQYVYKTREYRGPATEAMLVEANNNLALAKGELDDAQRNFDRLNAGADSPDVIAARAKVDAAQATVNQLSIIAPFNGQVLSVDDHVGDVVNTGELSVNLADMKHLYIETQVDESDIANVKLGNQAEVTLDAVAGVMLTGKVSAINPVGEVVSGLVKYTVRVDLDKVDGDVFLPLGTTANVVIKVKEAAATLAVPIAAIQNDSKGEYVWVIESDGSTTRVDVVSGSIVGDLVAVSGDLKDGDRLQLINDGGFQAPNPLGGR
ncbi:MAG: efflux RND transporter periplasmic adaptor subunit [Anaerolineales bacterium]|nr:efflux RND transporter periplasmic adaptor subunit [Anaerolineales bacterium]